MLEITDVEECKYWLIIKKELNETNQAKFAILSEMDQYELTYCKLPDNVETYTYTQIHILYVQMQI